MRWIMAGLLCAALVAGCGSSNKSSGSSSTPAATATATATATASASASASATSAGGSSSLAVDADPSGALKFTQTSLTAKAGAVTVKFTNMSSVPHGVSIEGNGVDKGSSVVTGKSTSFTVTLKPGKYTFYCPVDGHRAAGMQGTLTVN